MASGSEDMLTPDEDTPVEVPETTDVKGDGKKRKFKPLEAMRKLFKGGRKRSKSKDDQQGTIVTQKAKSTPALQTANEDEDDDDGGFKNRATRPLGGARSISEDSVFSPEQRDPSLGPLNKIAVSEENLARPAFHNELFSKLKKRQSQYSEDDGGAEDGFGQLKTQASSSRESDKSLISMDSSDNEEEDIFMSNWPAAQKPKRVGKSSGSSQPMDFESVKSSQHLTSDAAKHKLSVRPNKRKASRQSRIHRDVKATHGLPSLHEESPVKTEEQSSYSITSTDVSQSDMSNSYSEVLQVSHSDTSDKTNISIVLLPQTPNTEPLKPSRDEPTSPGAVSTSGETKKEQTAFGSSHISSVKVEEKSSPKVLRSHSGRPREGSDVQGVVPSSDQQNELSQAFNKVKRRSVKLTQDEERDALPSKEAAGASMPSHVSGPAVSVSGKSGDKVEVKSSSKPQQSSVSVCSTQSSQSEPKDSNITVISTSVDHKQPVVKKVSSESRKEEDNKSETSSVKSNTSFKREGLKATDTSDVVSPAREDYKLRRQSRSKTLPEQPVAKDEQYASKIQRTNSHRVDFGSGSPSASPKKNDVMTSSAIMTSDLTAKKSDPKRWTWTEPVNTEPEWMAALRKKKAVGNDSESNAGTKTQQSEAKPKEVFTVDVGKDKKKVESVGQTVGSTKTKATVNSQVEVAPLSKTGVGYIPGRGGSVKVDSATRPDSVKSFTSRASSVKVPSSKSDTVSAKISPTEETTKSFPRVEPAKTSRVEPAKMSRVEPVKSTRVEATKSFRVEPNQTSKAEPTKSSRIEPTKPSSTVLPDSAKPLYSLADSRKSFSKTDSPKTSPSIVTSSTPSEPKKTFSRVDSTKASSPSHGSNLPKVSESEVNKKPDSKPAMSFNSRGSVQSKDSVAKPSATSWKTNTQKKENVKENPLAPVKIEIIEKDQPKVEVPLKKKISPLTSETPEKFSSHRSSKVLDMVKNFQKMQTAEPVVQ
ncbi:dentin sialophosphoprotein-like [Gigantopelta aegis]|uniref:dentin sialophosphoprotein-like n=1 Tax=Gigantopelta aegis TaxID=1735272 RepID=UPI001B889534|nr:dentin sialophosphoprotein-like [Gigantopelta aegis]